MPINAQADIEITAYDWVPDIVQGLVRDLRPRWACEELGLPYRERLISSVERPKWYQDEQPWGQVPFLQDGAITLFESTAILIHLAERSGALLPREGQARADVLGWLMASANTIEPLLFELQAVDIFAASKEWAALRRPSLYRALARRLRPVEQRLQDREWITDSFSIADIALVTTLRAIARGGQLASHAALLDYLARAEARPAFRNALAAQLAPFNANAQKYADQA